MKQVTAIYTTLLIAAIVGMSLVSCKYPYQPETFIMPAIPPDRYQFPSTTAIADFTGSSNVKIVFTLKENGVRVIHYIDYTDPAPTLKKLKQPAGKENYHTDSPLLSPDGSFVTYFVTPGAVIAGAYIQRLDPAADPILVSARGTEPHWWQDSTGQVFIIYSDNMESNLKAGQGNTYRQKVSLAGNGALVVGGSDTIAPYPMNGGLSRDATYLCTGYTKAAFYQLSTKKLTVINDGFQVCNPSIDPGPTQQDLMMFLNFEGTQNMTNSFQNSADYPKNAIGEIPQHSVLFITDAANTVRDFVPISLMGSSYQEWQDPEWSNKPMFATALAIINDATADGVIIKNIGDRATKKESLLFTKGIGKLDITSTPSLWIGN